MALLDNTGFSSVFADTMDDEVTFDNMFGAEEDDELMEFVLANSDGVVVEPVFEEAEVDASSIEKEEPDKDAVEGLSGPDINAKEIEKECGDNDLGKQIEEMFMTDKADKIMEEEAKEAALDEAYDKALYNLLAENDSDNAADNTSKEAPANVEDVDEAFLAEDKSDIEKANAVRLAKERMSGDHKKHFSSNIEQRNKQRYGQADPSNRAKNAKLMGNGAHDKAGKTVADEENKEYTDKYNKISRSDKEATKESYDAFFEGGFDDTLKNDVDSRGSEDFEMDTAFDQAGIISPTVPSDAEGKNAGPDINAKGIEDEEGTASSFDECWDDTLKNDVDSRGDEEFEMDLTLPQDKIVAPTVPGNAEGKGKEEIDAKGIEDEEGTAPELENATDPENGGDAADISDKGDGENSGVEEAFFGKDNKIDNSYVKSNRASINKVNKVSNEKFNDEVEKFADESFLGEESFDDTLKDDVDSRGSEEFSMDSDLPQAPIQKPTVPSNAEGKGKEEIDASGIEDEEGTAPELESAFFGEECWDDTLKNEVDCRDHGAEFSMDSDLPQDKIVKPTVPSNAEGKGKEEIDASGIEDEEGTAPELEAAFFGEANDGKQSDDLGDIGFEPAKNDGVEEDDMDDSEQLTDNQEVHEDATTDKMKANLARMKDMAAKGQAANDKAGKALDDANAKFGIKREETEEFDLDDIDDEDDDEDLDLDDVESGDDEGDEEEVDIDVEEIEDEDDTDEDEEEEDEDDESVEPEGEDDSVEEMFLGEAAKFQWLPEFKQYPELKKLEKVTKEAELLLNDNGKKIDNSTITKIGKVLLRFLDIYTNICDLISLPACIFIIPIPYYLLDRLIEWGIKALEFAVAESYAEKAIVKMQKIYDTTKDKEVKAEVGKKLEKMKKALKDAKTRNTELEDMDESFLGEESFDDTLKNNVDSRGSEDFEMDVVLPQDKIVSPTVPSDVEGKGEEELDASEIEDEAFFGEAEASKSVAANMEEPEDDIEDDIIADAEDHDDDLSDAELNDLLADDEEDEILDEIQ